MKLVLPIAGRGTRVRPLTHTIAKPLVPVAGKPVIQRIIDQVMATPNLNVTEIVFITGFQGEQVVAWAKEKYNIPVHSVEQKVPNGSGDAIRLAQPFIKGEDMLVLFCDTLFDADLEVIAEDKNVDGIIWAYEVEDPRRFGVIYHDEEDIMTEMIEKPDNPTSNLAGIGVYYIKDSNSLFAMIDVLYEEEIKTKGEYNFPEAIDLMAKNGKRIRVQRAEGWHDTGKMETLLTTNKTFCAREGVENSIAESAVIENSTLFNCIVLENARITDCDLKHAVIGPRAIVKHVQGQVFLGADAYVNGKH